MIRLRTTVVLAGLLGLPAAVMGDDAAATSTIVLISPAVQQALRTVYGEKEGAVLQQTVRERAGGALRGTGCDDVAEVEITLREARPTHPTDKQIADNAALDRLRTHYLGGAAFSVRLLAADGRELKALRYDWYAPNDQLGSHAAGPWGDVRLASEGLGSQLAHECRAPRHAHPATS